MRLLATMVTRNEAGRYLSSCLDWLKTCVDEIHVYDDQSNDETCEIVLSQECRLSVRSDDVPTFLEHEGRFRQAAWDAFERKLKPEPEDWVLALDADEFLVAAGKERLSLLMAVSHANFRGAEAVVLRFKEVFGFQGGRPMVRVDGYWDSIAHPRLFRYRSGGLFWDRPMACGSEPAYVYRASTVSNNSMVVLHYGYATDRDRAAKYARYSTTSGHNSSHVESILHAGHLESWDGKIPCSIS